MKIYRLRYLFNGEGSIILIAKNKKHAQDIFNKDGHFTSNNYLQNEGVKVSKINKIKELSEVIIKIHKIENEKILRIIDKKTKQSLSSILDNRFNQKLYDKIKTP